VGKIIVYDKITIGNQKKGENIEVKEIVHKSPSNRWFRNGIPSFPRRADARESVDIIYRM